MTEIRMDGDCVCGCMNDPDFASPPDGLPDRLAIARDDLRRESARTEMAFRERDQWKENYEAMQRVAKRATEEADRGFARALVAESRVEVLSEVYEAAKDYVWAEDNANGEYVIAAAERLLAALRHLDLEPDDRDLVEKDLEPLSRPALSSGDATRPTGDKEKAAPKDGLS